MYGKYAFGLNFCGIFMFFKSLNARQNKPATNTLRKNTNIDRHF